jgi:hypothetical protein
MNDMFDVLRIYVAGGGTTLIMNPVAFHVSH